MPLTQRLFGKAPCSQQPAHRKRTAFRLKALATVIGCVTLVGLPAPAGAVSSAELYTTAAYQYGRYEARVQFAAGDGVVSSFFLWKDGSELADVFWNELDFEKLRADFALETNALYGSPEMSHTQVYDAAVSHSADDLCGGFHTYAYEWTPDTITWFIDGVEIRRETGASAAAFRDNAAQGMQIHFNIWPGDASFGGNFDPAILPLYQYVNWVQFSAYVDGQFQLQWREDFAANALPSGWNVGSWQSPKNLSTHASANVTFKSGFAVLSLTADNATGAAGANPMDTESSPPDTPDAGPAATASDAGASATAPTSTGAAGASTTAPPMLSAGPPSSGAVPAASDVQPGVSASTAAPVPPAAGSSTAAIPANSVAAQPTAAPSNSATAPQTTNSAGGVPSVASATATSMPSSGSEASGCDCRVARTQAGAPWSLLAVLLALPLGYIRRSRLQRRR